MTDLPKHAAPPYEPVAVDAADIVTVYDAVTGAGLPDTDTVVTAATRMMGAVPEGYGEITDDDPLRTRLGAALTTNLPENMQTLIDGERLLDALVIAARS